MSNSVLLTLNAHNKIPNTLFPSLIYWVFFANYMLTIFTYTPNVIIFSIRMAIGAISIVYCILKKKLTNSFNVFSFMLIYTVFGIFAHMYNGNADLIELCWPIAFMGLSVMLINYPIKRTQATLFLLLIWLFCALFYFTHGSFSSYLLRSVNSISVMLLMFYSLFAITYTKQNQSAMSPTLLLFSLICLLVCFLTVGRSSGGRAGVLTFTFISTCNLFYFLFTYKQLNKLKYIYRLFIISLILICCIVVYNSINELANEHLLYLKSRSYRSPRTQMWLDYIKIANESSFNFILGGNFAYKTELFSRHPENLHNSFLMLHAKYTIFMLISVALLICRSLYIYLKRKSYVIIICFLGLIIRMNFDYTNFNSVLDTLLIYYIFIPYSNKKGYSHAIYPAKVK